MSTPMAKESKYYTMDVLEAVELITSDTKKPAEYRHVKDLVDMPPSSVYHKLDEAAKEGLLAKGESESGFKAATLTLKGYRKLGENPERISFAEEDLSEFPEQTEDQPEQGISYQDAYNLLMTIACLDIEVEHRLAFIESIDKLIKED